MTGSLGCEAQAQIEGEPDVALGLVDHPWALQARIEMLMKTPQLIVVSGQRQLRMMKSRWADRRGPPGDWFAHPQLVRNGELKCRGAILGRLAHSVRFANWYLIRGS